MATARDRTETGYYILGPEESREFFDHQARNLMNMSGEEFIRRWDAGEFDEQFDKPGYEDLTQLVMLLPFGRQ